MNIINFNDKYDSPIVLAMGFFDCVHIGHKSLFDEAKNIAIDLGAESAAITFDNDINAVIGNMKHVQVYTLCERTIAIKNQDIKNLIVANLDENMANWSGDTFLDELTSRFDIKGVVVGKDYHYGKNACCGTAELKAYFAKKNVLVKVLPFVTVNNVKVSTSSIKKVIGEGNIQIINSLLTQPYFIAGKIVHSCARGTILGFPTANIEIVPNRMKLGEGVYATKIFFDDKLFYGVTNVGKKPTFDDKEYTIETYIFGFNGDLYNKDVILVFHNKIRDIIKFNSVPEFRHQLDEDCKASQAFFGMSFTHGTRL